MELNHQHFAAESSHVYLEYRWVCYFVHFYWHFAPCLCKVSLVFVAFNSHSANGLARIDTFIKPATWLPPQIQIQQAHTCMATLFDLLVSRLVSISWLYGYVFNPCLTSFDPEHFLPNNKTVSAQLRPGQVFDQTASCSCSCKQLQRSHSGGKPNAGNVAYTCHTP